MFNHQRNIIQTLLVLYFLLSYDGVQGDIKLSKQEELALEKQLKLLNKSFVKTIKTKWGDTYDCVDFYKQPAFDNPLLKNHNFHPEMKPTLPTIQQISSDSTVDIPSRISSENERCPSGTVPIKRVTKDDIIRQKRMPPPENFTSEAQSGDTTNNLAGRYMRAMVQTPNNPNNKFAGAGMIATVWGIAVQGQQNSACRMKIQKGQDSIQVSWRADPTLYGDSKARLFIHFQAGKTQCFNTLCQGFVIVDRSIQLDQVLDPVSHPGSRQYGIEAYIDRDLKNGNWWLLLGNNQTAVGFWPPNIFTALANDLATNVEWGGVTYTPTGGAPYAPMGSGYWPVDPNPTLDAYCKGLIVLDDKGETISVKDTNKVVDNPLVYRVIDDPKWGTGKFPHWVFYGGPQDRNGHLHM